MKLRLKKLCALFILAGVVLTLVLTGGANAQYTLGSSLSSDNFRILDPQHGGFGGVSSSSSGSFRLIGTIGDMAIGSSSATSFGLRSGFLYFPHVVAATLNTATAGDGQVSLAWLAAEAFQGWNVSGYNVCTKPSAGSYTCVSVGNVTSYTKTSLTNGTSYTFKIQAKDGLGNVIADSNEMSATPTGSASPGGGGGGGGGPGTTGGLIILDGFGYPRTTVTVLRDGQVIGTAFTDVSGRFNFSSSFVSGGTYKYSLYGTDRDGIRSAMTSLFVTVQQGSSETVNGIVLPPTISLADDQIERGEPLIVRGYAFPGSQIYGEVSIRGVYGTATAGADGHYEFTLQTGTFPNGIHAISTRATVSSGQQSIFSTPAGFGVNVPFKKRQFNIPGCGLLEQPDLNCDGKVNIVDVSILMFYFKKPLIAGREFVDFNGDGKVDLTEFSIMVYFWTG